MLLFLFAPLFAWATPSTTYWSVTTAGCQSFAVPHLTYDSYFGRGPSIGSAGSPGLPIDTGLTIGFLPFEKFQGEVGADLLFPSQDPIYLNAKFCFPESAVFSGSPGLGFGIYNVGTRPTVNDYNILYAVLQKAIPGVGGSLAVGFYYGLTRSLFINSDGLFIQSGFLASVTSPDIVLDLKGLQKFNIVADVQTGKNVVGAWGVGATIFFAENVSMITGPVFFLDPVLQPGSSSLMWTLQLDVDLGLKKQ